MNSSKKKHHQSSKYFNIKKYHELSISQHLHFNGKFVLINPPLEGQKCAPINKPPFFEKVFLTFSAKIWQNPGDLGLVDLLKSLHFQRISMDLGMGHELKPLDLQINGCA